MGVWRRGGSQIPEQHTTWIRLGILALPIYGLLTIWASLDPQPDQVKHPEAWARFVSSNHYMLTHVIGSIGGAVLAILGVFALGAYLANSRAGRLGLVAMVVTVVGQAVGLVIGGISTFATPAIGQAFLSGFKDVMQIQFSPVMSVIFALAILLMIVGNVLLGVAVWRSGTLPKWAGAIWLASLLLFYILGAVLGILTTGSSLPTQPVGALLIVISGTWMAWSVMRQPSTRMVGATNR
jgi:MFS family permease